MWNIKLKTTNAQNRKTNKKFTDTDNSLVVIGRMKVGGVKGKGGQIYGDGRFDFGWWAHNAIY